MPAALGVGMDAVMFELKGAHLAVQRVGRGLLRGFGMTPARFDLMFAVWGEGMKQSDLWRLLNVVRSVVCEMVRDLETLGWVERERDPEDRRTWIVKLTARGRALLERAYGERVANGVAAWWMDYGLAQGHFELEGLRLREDLVFTCDGLMHMFRTQPSFFPPDLYVCDPEEYYHWFADLELTPGPGDLPFVA